MLLAHDHSELDAALGGVFSALADEEVERSFKNLDLFWARLAMHIRAEHLHLFPTLLHALETREQRNKGSRAPSLEVARDTIAQLRDDHDFFMSELAAALKQLRELRENGQANVAPTLGNVGERIEAVSVRLQAHNELEGTQVYRWADAALDDAEQEALNERLRRELENLPVRFQAASCDMT